KAPPTPVHPPRVNQELRQRHRRNPARPGEPNPGSTRVLIPMLFETSYRRAGQAMFLAIAAGIMLATPARAQINDRQPDEVQNIEIVEHLDDRIPLDLRFRDENGKEVVLSDYFNDDKPVLLNLVYLNCPMLCTLVVNGTFDALKLAEMGEEQFNMITVSFVYGETPAMARAKMDNYIGRYGMTAGAAEWHILTGEVSSSMPLF